MTHISQHTHPVRSAHRPRLVRRIAAAACVMAAVGAAAGAAQAHDGPHAAHPGKPSKHELREARQATERYRTVEAAEKAGYVLTPECVADPAAGGMGIHAVNEKLMADGKLDHRRPEILVYAKNGAGKLRLAALEYFAPDADGDPGTDDRPSLFGQRFDGPFGAPGEPPVYLLHAWVHKRNPAGVFAPFNPRVSCD
jgi:hypothetical protein